MQDELDRGRRPDVSACGEAGYRVRGRYTSRLEVLAVAVASL